MWKINVNYLQGYRSTKKEDKDFEKNKSADIFFVNTSVEK